MSGVLLVVAANFEKAVLLLIPVKQVMLLIPVKQVCDVRIDPLATFCSYAVTLLV